MADSVKISDILAQRTSLRVAQKFTEPALSRRPLRILSPLLTDKIFFLVGIEHLVRKLRASKLQMRAMFFYSVLINPKEGRRTGYHQELESPPGSFGSKEQVVLA